MKLKAWMFAVLMSATVAQANLYTLDQSQCTTPPGCGTGPYGQVEVTETGLDQLSFSVQLFNGYTFHNTTSSQHPALAFSLAGNPQITISQLSSAFVANGPQTAIPFQADGSGSFEYLIQYRTAVNPHPVSLSFIAEADGLALASLEPNAKGFFFAVDIRDGLGNTGNVSAVPEPSQWMMVLAGLLAIGSIASRRARNGPPA
jgi:hypothetical protein